MKKESKVLGLLLLLIGLILIHYNIINNFWYEKIENNKITNYFKNDYDAVPMTKKKKIIELSNKGFYKSYIGIIEIPKISLKKGFYRINSKYNNVANGIEVLKDSTFPERKNSTLILASHSGNSKVSHFKDLIYLTKNNLVYIYYKNKKYIYKIEECDKTNKNGHIKIKQYEKGRRLILTTCKNDELDKQYTCYAINIEERN